MAGAVSFSPAPILPGRALGIKVPCAGPRRLLWASRLFLASTRGSRQSPCFCSYYFSATSTYQKTVKSDLLISFSITKPCTGGLQLLLD